MTYPTQPGITPPAPGQEKEEPELWQEDDIPKDDEKGRASEDKGQRHPERGRGDD
jgi:hypothetical protein